MQIAVTGMKITNTSHATWDITAMVPIICMTEKAHQPSLIAISKSSTLWSVDACKVYVIYFYNKYTHENLHAWL